MATLTLAPNGLQWVRHKLSTAQGFATNNNYYIRAGYTGSAIGFGDLVQTGTSTNAGYVIQYAAGNTNVLGVFAGVGPYFDTVLNAVVPGKNYWAGTESPSGDVPVYIIDDPWAVFRIQVSGGPLMTASRGLNADVSGYGAPNSVGISTAALNYSTVATTSTLPLRIVGWSTVAAGGSTTYDPTTATSANQPTNNYAEVTLNPGACENLLGTGI